MNRVLRCLSVWKWRGALPLLLVLLACDRPVQEPTFPPKHESVGEHRAESERHEEEAQAHKKQAQAVPPGHDAADIQCYDDPLIAMEVSRNERERIMRPCWTREKSERHSEESQRHREEAARHRRKAQALVDAETRDCAGLGALELSRSPLTRTADILRVDPLSKEGKPAGAVILVRQVPGLTEKWLRRSLRCHQARAAALGYPPTFMSKCPATLPDVSVRVSRRAQGIEVVLRARREAMAAAVLSRAKALVSAP